MRMDISPEAAERLTHDSADQQLLLKLVYDSEGCGCAVSGVPQLWRVAAAQPGDIAINEGGITVLAEARHTVFFEDVVRLGYEPSKNCYTLKSDGQIYNNRLRIIDKTT